MNEPPRLREGNPSALEGKLLEAGMAYRSSSRARKSTLAALGLAGSAAVSVGAGTASASLLEKLGVSKLVAISGLGALLAVPAGYYVWQRQSSPAPSVVSAPPPRALEAQPEGRVAPAEPPPVTNSPSPASEPVAPKAGSRAVPSGALGAELNALDVARSKLAAGDATGALAQLDEYARAFPRGRLDLEAEVLRIDALAKAGQGDAARKRAESFLKRHPKSVLASRVRGYLKEGP